MSIADELALLANTKENLRVSLGLSKDVPFSQYILSTPFTPRHLFISGEQGAWYDPSDLSTLFQDASGTTPVTATGEPVGLMLDKSGNGNHATQKVSAAKPTYQTDGTLHWLEFDGVDDGFKLSFSTPVKPENSIYMGVNAEKLGIYPFLLTQSSYTPSRLDWLLRPSQNLLNILQKDTSMYTGFVFGSATVTSVDSGSTLSVRNNGVQSATAPASQVGLTELFIGSQFGLRNYAKFKLYGMLVFEGGVYNSGADAYLADKTGVTL